MTTTDSLPDPTAAEGQAAEAAWTLPWDGATNPVLPGFHPDPSVCRVDGADGTWYYAVTSTFEYLPGLPVHRSRDLVSWELVGHAIHRDDQVDLTSVRDSGGMFAPTIRHDGRRFLVACTLVGGSAGSEGNFVVTAEDPSGPWSDPVWWHGSGIDPSLLVDDDGRLWAQGTRPAGEPQWDQQTEVWVREVDRDTLLLVGEEQVVWTGALRGAIWAEGPHLYRRDGYVYLLASEGGTAFHHAVSVARSTSPTGPFEGNPANPVLTHRHLGTGSEIVNVGHADLVDAPDGTSWALVLATRPVGGTDLLGRETYLVPVEWQDGWPVFAPGVGRLVSDPPYPVLAGGAPAPTRPAPAESQLLAVRRQPDDVVQVGPDGDLELVAGPGLCDPLPAFVGRRLTSTSTSVEVEVVDVPEGASLALALRYSSQAWVSLSLRVTAGAAEVVASRSDGSVPLVLASVDVPGPARGRLRLDLVGLRAVAVWHATGGDPVEVATFSLAPLGAAVSGGFVGTVYGVLAEGAGTVRVRGLRVTAPSSMG